MQGPGVPPSLLPVAPKGEGPGGCSEPGLGAESARRSGEYRAGEKRPLFPVLGFIFYWSGVCVCGGRVGMSGRRLREEPYAAPRPGGPPSPVCAGPPRQLCWREEARALFIAPGNDGSAVCPQPSRCGAGKGGLHN